MSYFKIFNQNLKSKGKKHLNNNKRFIKKKKV